MKTSITDFGKFFRIYRLDVGVNAKEMKSFVRCYLKNQLKPQIEDMVIKGFTLQMMFKSITQNDETLGKHMNFNTFRSWVRTNIKKGEVKALIAQARFLEMKDESLKSGAAIQRHKDEETFVANSDEASIQKKTKAPDEEILSPVSYATTSRYKSQNNKSKVTSLLIPKPKLPLREMTSEECTDYFGNNFSNIMVDSNNFIFDGYSSNDESSLVPIPSGYEVLPEQDGLNTHYFTSENTTISSKNLRSFLETRIANGFTNLIFLTLGEEI